MLRDVITSFWGQNFARSELVIVDDASPDQTGTLVQAAAHLDGRIVYRGNPTNVGYCENLRRTLLLARGQFIVVLGDDDILLGPNALAKFVDVFEKHPDVHFAYPNQIQMDGTMNFDLISRHFGDAATYDPGAASFQTTWLKSILITGIAVRRSDALYRLYPDRTMLFPQVEMVGRLLCHHGSYGIPDFLVAARAHSDQLGFHANRGHRIVGPERHGTMEILDMAERSRASGEPAPNFDKTAKALAYALATNLPNEKLRGSTRVAVSNAMQLMRRSSAARRTILPVSMIATAVLPPVALNWLHKTIKRAIRRLQQREAAWFALELDRQAGLAEDAWRTIGAVAPSTSRSGSITPRRESS